MTIYSSLNIYQLLQKAKFFKNYAKKKKSKGVAQGKIPRSREFAFFFFFRFAFLIFIYSSYVFKFQDYVTHQQYVSLYIYTAHFKLAISNFPHIFILRICDWPWQTTRQIPLAYSSSPPVHHQYNHYQHHQHKIHVNSKRIVQIKYASFHDF